MQVLVKKGFRVPKFIVVAAAIQEKELISRISKLKGRLILRSSASGEDSAENSFAGIYESKVIDKKDNAYSALKELLIKSYSDRVIHYMKMKGIKKKPGMAIIVQEYIQGEVSGVLFTQVNQHGKIGALINANYGGAESVVQGCQCQSYFTRGNSKIDCLSKKQIRALVKIGKKIEKLFGKPQDIEWTINGNKVYILQSRPITAAFNKNLKVWDNSNIAESYSSIVLPLTCSFAKDIYKRVYIDVARTSGISEKKVKENKEVFENLLGFFYGRFYYNMLNWYKMLLLFPGYKRNKHNLEQMIAIRTKADIEEQPRISALFCVKYYIHTLIRYFFFEGTLENFKSHVRDYYSKTSKLHLGEKTLGELLSLYDDFRKELLSRWSVTVDNDFLAMTFFGMLNKSSGNMPQLMADIRNVISAQQVETLYNLSQIFKKTPLLKLAQKGKYKQCYEQIKEYSELQKGIGDYLSKYGGRFANELKLESEDLDSNPAYIVKLLCLYAKAKKRIQNAEKQTHQGYILSRAKHYLRHREELRLLRSQAFSYIRKIFQEIGIKLQKQGLLGNWKDIFYLEVGEIRIFIEGGGSVNLKAIINKRKKDYLKNKKIELPNTFVTEGDKLKPSPIPRDMPKGALNGIGCSSGIVKGKVKILESFALPKTKSYEIVVTKHTDPGWTPLFGLCKGIIVEHGGLLSHAAIISRELNLPCVIGARNATKLLKDGQTVTINGFLGEIKIEK
ncbi:MAG: hypothetical protein KKC75_04555 [Nanoarchaeota archaeon]|nr:hypothetical protein [Nanoarchaeota archaeon]